MIGEMLKNFAHGRRLKKLARRGDYPQAPTGTFAEADCYQKSNGDLLVGFRDTRHILEVREGEVTVRTPDGKPSEHRLRGARASLEGSRLQIETPKTESLLDLETGELRDTSPLGGRQETVMVSGEGKVTAPYGTYIPDTTGYLFDAGGPRASNLPLGIMTDIATIRAQAPPFMVNASYRQTRLEEIAIAARSAPYDPDINPGGYRFSGGSGSFGCD